MIKSNAQSHLLDISDDIVDLLCPGFKLGYFVEIKILIKKYKR
ncbi:MAG: hypothetical protein QF743_06330 [Candidatus Marinimicrobia bacterium]|jgi:hypothetical protein|nr:hypothetical protein [Candidatus Neomarinimicrobiota bacterium]|tara:strand:- start:61 stop:189 length:129 start_codon:yes stop_codon:yes gene_type:complete